MIGFFNEFKDGALTEFYLKKVNEQELKTYIDDYYFQWKKSDGKLF